MQCLEASLMILEQHLTRLQKLMPDLGDLLGFLDKIHLYSEYLNLFCYVTNVYCIPEAGNRLANSP